MQVDVDVLKSRKGSLDPARCGAMVRSIWKSDVNSVINLTSGEGCSVMLSEANSPLPLAAYMARLFKRNIHVAGPRPEFGTAGCGSMHGKTNEDNLVVNTTGTPHAMARLQQCGVKPEIEVFDSDRMLRTSVSMTALLTMLPLIQVCTEIGYGAPDDLNTLIGMVHQLPSRAAYSPFSMGHMQLPYVALAPLVDANV
ncbi:uncharacterized protein (DUF849 family) [Bradyrhizobium sp. GM0.4]